MTARPGAGTIGTMGAEPKRRAEQRLERTFAERGLVDGREAYRVRLRDLRDRDPDAFARATRHYEERVLPGLLAEDPVEVWIEFGGLLGQLTGPGRVWALDGTGRAGPYHAPWGEGTLVLWVPEDTKERAFTVAEPSAQTAAQRAALGLLVEGRLAL